MVPFRADEPVPSAGDYAVAEFPTDNGPADYALATAGRVLSITEAKKVTLGPQNVLTLPKRPQQGLQGLRLRTGLGLSPSIPVRSKRLQLGFPGGGALHSCSESSLVEPANSQMGNVG